MAKSGKKNHSKKLQESGSSDHNKKVVRRHKRRHKALTAFNDSNVAVGDVVYVINNEGNLVVDGAEDVFFTTSEDGIRRWTTEPKV